MPETSDLVTQWRDCISLDGVREARKVIAPHLQRTPLMRHPLLVDALGCEVYVKHENHLPTGAFKVRGGLNYMANLSPEKRERGVITATRGNHGQSIGLAAKLNGVHCIVTVPKGNNPEKNDAMRAYGVELKEVGDDFDEAREYAAELSQSEGLTFVHPANDPDIINGVGTYALEVAEDLPDVDAIIVPVGGGSGICGVATVFRALKPEVEIIGVQAENAPSVYESWKSKSFCPTESANTFADGLATRVPCELPFEIMQEGVDDMLLVSEDEFRDAVKLLLTTTHNLAEGAGAALFAAIAKYPDRFRGRTVAAILSGGNMDAVTLKWVLES